MQTINYEWNGPDDTDPVLVAEKKALDLDYTSEFGNVDAYLRNPIYDAEEYEAYKLGYEND